MKVIIPYWQGRISPVFDVAENFYLIEIRNGREFSRKNIVVYRKEPFARAAEFTALDIEVLICGAISNVQEIALRNAGIQVFAFICGDTEAVITAFIKGELPNGRFKMPGCCGRRQRHGDRYGGKREN